MSLALTDMKPNFEVKFVELLKQFGTSKQPQKVLDKFLGNAKQVQEKWLNSKAHQAFVHGLTLSYPSDQLVINLPREIKKSHIRQEYPPEMMMEAVCLRYLVCEDG